MIRSRFVGVTTAMLCGGAMIATMRDAAALSTVAPGTSVSVYSQPPDGPHRLVLGTSTSGTMTGITISVGGTDEVADVTFNVTNSPVSVHAKFDFHNGNTFEMDAALTFVRTTSNAQTTSTTYHFDSATNYVGTGVFAGTTASITFQTASGLSQEFVTTSNSTHQITQQVIEWSMSGTVLGPPLSIGDYVWGDVDGDGIQDTDESGIDGLRVDLLDGFGGFLASTNTHDGGQYLFHVALAGDYRIKFSALPSYTFSPQAVGSNQSVDSNPDATGLTASFHLTGDDLTIDAGIIPPPPPRFSVGDFVWNDADGDGIQDDDELGLPNVFVELLNSGGGVIGSMSTDADGHYMFGDLLEADYSLRFTLAPGFSFSPQGAGTDTDLDSNVAVSTGVTSFHLSTNDKSQDAGMIPPPAPRYSIGNFVWNDANGNGVQDNGELGIPGVTVDLLDGTSDTPVIATDTTDADGKYDFGNLLDGYYRVRFTLQNGYTFSTQNAGSDDAVDSDADSSTGVTVSFHLTHDDDTVDAGMVAIPAPRYTIGNFVWNDVDGDGLQDSGELGLDGVTVALLDGTSDTPVVPPVVTTGGGFYEFGNLLEGDYRVRFTLRDGYTFSPQDAGNDAADSDADTTTGVTDSFHLSADDSTRDAGMVLIPAPTFSIGDLVWLDNGNGIHDSGEAGIDGVTVQLLDGSGAVIGTDVTAGGGFYEFGGLIEGNYKVRFTLPSGGYIFAPKDQGSDDTADSDADTSTGTTISFLLNANDTTRDAGMILPPPPRYTLGDFVWNDADGDGFQDTGELGIDGVTVQLIDATLNTVVATDVTAGGGFYEFGNLLGGDYRVKFVLVSGYSFASKDVGSNDAKDSDADTATGETATFTLHGDDSTRDAGMVPPAPRYTVGNFVWRDLDGDGVQDSGEPGINGVTVQLLQGSTGSTVLATTTTSGGGVYSFGNLLEGDYRLKFILPSGYAFAAQDSGSNDALDSDAGTTSGITAAFHLQADDLTRDAGMVSTGGGGHTPGFWQNKNGQKLIGSDDIKMLVGLNLVNANGSAFNPKTAAEVGTWITSDAVNMAYKLSSMLASMELNVYNGLVSGSATVYTGDCASNLGTSTISIANLMAMANTDLGTTGHNYTVANGTIRTRQECIKIVLDRACNNLNWVNP